MKRRSRLQLWGLLGALAFGLGLLGMAAFGQLPNPRDMGMHWQAFLVRPGTLAAWRLAWDFHHCPPSQCVSSAGLQESDVARLTALARQGQMDAVRLELILNRMPTAGDIGSEDTVLCCGPVILGQPDRFLRLSREVGLDTTRVVTASQLETDEDYAGYGRELQARRTSLARVGDPSLAAWRDRDIAALDAALKHNQAFVDTLNTH